MELVTGGEIFWKVASQNHLSENESRKYFQQLINALDYCHNYGIYHRDLKPENLLLDESGNLKISDFGLSAKIGPNGILTEEEKKTAAATLLTTRCGTPQYAAPEVIKKNGYFGPAVDIWACGVILYVFITGVLPFDAANEATLFQKIIDGKVSYPPIINDDVKDLLESIFIVDPIKRLTLEQIIEHKWFTVDYEPINSNVEVDINNVSVDNAVKSVATTGQSVPSVNLSTMNAFDLINKAGTLNFTRLIRSTKTQITKPPSYFTTRSAANVIIFRLRSILDATPYIGYKYIEKSFILKVTGKAKAKGFILFDIIISKVTEDIRMVDFQRKSGSILEFWRLYQQIKDECNDLVSIKSPPSNCKNQN